MNNTGPVLILFNLSTKETYGLVLTMGHRMGKKPLKSKR